MPDEPGGTGLRPAVLVANTGYGANADFHHGLEDPGLAYVLHARVEVAAHGEAAEPTVGTAADWPTARPTVP
ncbi:hypothetical protein [Streptomyces sp. NPDC006463]|uniref:hypothetical protein n=1 Tax=Streptomyces sp. NPDC006463 TaxID=3364746 RepID=UPI0036A2E837